MSDSNFTTPEQRAARDAHLAQSEHAMKLAGEVASLAMDNKVLRAALTLAERNAASRLYMLPLKAEATTRQAIETELATYRAALARTSAKEG